jgi:hypothetical protein
MIEQAVPLTAVTVPEAPVLAVPPVLPNAASPFLLACV